MEFYRTPFLQAETPTCALQLQNTESKVYACSFFIELTAALKWDFNCSISTFWFNAFSIFQRLKSGFAYVAVSDSLVPHFAYSASRPVHTGNFCCDLKHDFAACKLLAIQIAAESSVVYTARLIALEIAAKIASVNGPLLVTRLNLE